MRLRTQRGFTLVEMAVVVVVMALILGSILVPLSTQVEQRQVVETQRLLEDMKEALIGYALTQTPPHLPCPDKTTAGGSGTANDGIEDFEPTTGACVVPEGNLPWATLGIGAADPWGNRYRYRVTLGAAQRVPVPPAPVTTFNLGSMGDILVCPASTLCGPGQALTVQPSTVNSPVALILSHGPNGWGATNASTSSTNSKPPGTSALGNDESVNVISPDVPVPATFVSRSRVSDDGANPSPEFDDIVIWLSPHTLKHRLVAAGKLP